MPLSTTLSTESHLPEMNAAAGAWASKRIWGRPDGFSKFCSVTVVKDGVVAAAVILHEWHEDRSTIEISCAGDTGWQSRRVINEVMRVCFDQMGCQAVITRCDERNTAAMENCGRLGFTANFVPHVRGRGIGEWVFVLTDRAWKAGRIYKPA